MEQNDQVYIKLQKHLNKQPVGFPATKTGVEIRILKHIFTSEEAEIASFLSYKFEPLRIIYKRVEHLVESPEELEKIKGTRYFAICALRKRKHISHYSLSEALEVIRLVSPEHAYLTHVSHLMGSHAETTSELPDNVSFAWDGLSFDV